MRIAELEDLQTVLDMSMKFMDSIGYKDFSDEASISELIVRVLSAPHDEQIIILDDFGFIAGQKTKFPFGPDYLASEIAWWIDPESRGENRGLKLMNAFEYWAKNIANCRFISMTSLDKNVEKVYKKNGYKLYERAYMKVL